MQIRAILYQYIKTLIKHVFLLNFTYELLMSFRMQGKERDLKPLYLTILSKPKTKVLMH